MVREQVNSQQLIPLDIVRQQSLKPILNSNCSTNETAEKFKILTDFKHENIQKYEELLKANDIESAGIEFIIDQNGQSFTYDINTNTNYNSAAETKSENKGMATIAEFLGRELQILKDNSNIKKAS